MGWFGTYESYNSPSEYADYELKEPNGFELVKRVIKKDPHYTAVSFSLVRDLSSGLKHIRVDLIEKDGNHWAHKPFHESDGPCVYTCPKTILNQSDCEIESAKVWRKKCYESQRSKASEKNEIIKLFGKLKQGTVIHIGASILQFQYIYNKSGTQIACKDESGELFKYSYNQFNKEALMNALKNC